MGKIGDKAINQDRPKQLSKPIQGWKCWKCFTGQRAGSQQTSSPETRTGSRSISEGKRFQRVSPQGLQDGKLRPLSMQPRACLVHHDGSWKVLSPTGRKISRALYSERSASSRGEVDKTNDFNFGAWRTPPPPKTLAPVISLLRNKAWSLQSQHARPNTPNRILQSNWHQTSESPQHLSVK